MRVRSYKIRGALAKITKHLDEIRADNLPVICASAGNHAQGVAYACQQLQIQGVIYMPQTTPKQKVHRVKVFGGDYVRIELVGDTFDDAAQESVAYHQSIPSVYVHPFDDIDVIMGQSTVGLEFMKQLAQQPDYIITPIGGGGLSAGLITYIKQLSPHTKVIGVEPKGAPSMHYALEQGSPKKLDKIDKFVDGAAVQKIGELNFEILAPQLDDMVAVDEGEVCCELLDLYTNHAIVAEPAGTLAVTALRQLQHKIKGKRVVCIVSGGNNDVDRFEEIKEKALIYKGVKHYFIIKFPQRAGALKEFVTEILGEGDDIVFFEFAKKNNREAAPALVGLELNNPENLNPIYDKLTQKGYGYEYLNPKEDMFSVFNFSSHIS